MSDELEHATGLRIVTVAVTEDDAGFEIEIDAGGLDPFSTYGILRSAALQARYAADAIFEADDVDDDD